MTLTDSACGENGTGPTGCPRSGEVYIEFTDRGGTELAAVLCHEHAAGLRAGADIWEEAGWYFDQRPYTVTMWRST